MCVDRNGRSESITYTFGESRRQWCDVDSGDRSQTLIYLPCLGQLGQVQLEQEQSLPHILMD